MTPASPSSIPTAAPLRSLAIHLLPGDDLRRELEKLLLQHGASAAFVLAGLGSLRTASVRLAGLPDAITIEGDTLLPAWHFARDRDPATGWKELVTVPTTAGGEAHLRAGDCSISANTG